MNQSLVTIITTLKPFIIIAGLIPFMAAIIMWGIFYSKYDKGRLSKIRDSLQKLSDEGDKIKDCKKENLTFMDEMIVRMAPPYFLEAYLRMQIQIDKSYKGKFIPDGQSFYDFDTMVNAPGARSRLDALWKSFWVLSIVTILSPVGAAFFMQLSAITSALVLGMLLFVILCISHLIFTMLDQKIYFSTKSEYLRFIGAFNRILPVARPEVALLLEATQRNQESYQAATDKIAEKFDHLVDEVLLPALDDSIATIMHSNLIPALQNIEKTLDSNMTKTLSLQESGMERMTTAFADRLGDTVEAKMTGLASTIESVQTSMKLLNETMADQIQTMTETFGHSMDKQEEGMERISNAFSTSLMNTMEPQIASLASTIGEVRDQMAGYKHSLSEHIKEFVEATGNSLSIQKEQTENSIQLQDQRIEAMLNIQDQRIDQMMETQAKNMGAITSSFTESLTATLSENISGINDGLGRVKGEMNTINESLALHMVGLSETLADQRQVMEESANILMNAAEVQEKTLSESKEIQRSALENTEKLNDHIQTMTGILDNLTEQTNTFTTDAFQFTKETSEIQLRMSEDVKLSQGKLEAAVNETMNQYSKMNSMISDMMDKISSRMKEAMTSAGREIAFGIKEVTADNAEAISNLTEQAQNLRSDYESYFNRLEDTTVKTLEDMDYQVKTIISRITEDIGGMMENNIHANAEILERYKENTTDLLQSFDEQARSISLYAKEINMDIADLSNNLQGSVEEFGKKMQEGVQLTLGEFDNGLSEFTQRIANTVESISDAVEALPEALNRR